MNPDVTILYDSIRWEEKALLEAGKKKDINIQMVDCKKLASVSYTHLTLPTTPYV